jgi:hypothetical protein
MKNKLGPLYCMDCNLRDKCIELCKRAEHYVNQDSVHLREKLIGMSHPEPMNKWPAGEPETPPTRLTDREIVIGTLMFNKIPHKMIRNILKLRTKTYWNALNKLKKKLHK